MLNPAIALYLWLPVALALFTQLSTLQAIAWSMLLSFLLLPSEFAVDLPGLPPIDKVTLPNLVMFVLVMRKRRLNVQGMPPVALMLLAVIGVGIVGTSLTNADPVWTGDGDLPGLRPYDALASMVREFLTLLPLFVGWRWFGSLKSHRIFLGALLASGLAYSLLMLLEIRVSPQLHSWVYGYFPSDWRQQIRQGGFRPVVLLKHGLWCAFFAMSTVVAACGLWRDARSPSGVKSVDSPRLLLAAAYMFAVLVLCKSTGSLIYAIFLSPVLLLVRVKVQLRIALCMACLSIGYPLLRGAGLVPAEAMLELVSSFSEERAQSLETRLTNEGELLAHAEQRPVFGWGAWGRNRVHDLDTGEDLSITDGQWVMTIGAWGWVGYLARFGLLGLPLFLLWRRDRLAGRMPPATAALALLLGVSMIELLPNSVFMPWTWLMVGGLLGYASGPGDSSRAPSRLP